jgi:hypothetical protein
MQQVVEGGVAHIQSNQKLSRISVGLQAGCSSESVFNVMRYLANFSMFVEIVLVIISVFGILDWLVVDVPYIRIAPKSPAASSG